MIKSVLLHQYINYVIECALLSHQGGGTPIYPVLIFFLIQDESQEIPLK